MLYVWFSLASLRNIYSYCPQALSDENEFVRDTALRAGKRIINQYAETAVELLLPELERGLFDDNWRIRNSSVQLLGDLLYKVSGNSSISSMFSIICLRGLSVTNGCSSKLVLSQRVVCHSGLTLTLFVYNRLS